MILSMENDVQLDERIRRAAQSLKTFGAREVYLLGSAASGSMRAGSDVDMAVVGLPPEVFFRAMDSACRILERVLDLVDLDEPSPFTRHLRQEGKLVRVA